MFYPSANGESRIHFFFFPHLAVVSNGLLQRAFDTEHENHRWASLRRARACDALQEVKSKNNSTNKTKRATKISLSQVKGMMTEERRAHEAEEDEAVTNPT